MSRPDFAANRAVRDAVADVHFGLHVSAAELRRRIVSHGWSEPSDTGPVYVGCKCDRCEHDRAALAELNNSERAS